MKKNLKSLIMVAVLVLLVALIVIPIQAAASSINLIDKDGAEWTNVEANGNDVAFNFDGGKLTATAPGSWPYVLGVYNTPVTLVENDNPRIKIKFTVADDKAAASIRLVAGESGQSIYVHHFVEGASYDGSGDILAGTYTLDLPFFELKAFDGNAANEWVGTKDFEMTDGAVNFDRVQVWCSGHSDAITVTIDYFEIYYADEEGDPEDSEPEESSKPEESSEPEESSKPEESSEPEETKEPEVSSKPEESDPKPQPGDKGIITLAVFAALTIGAGGLISRKRRSK